MVGEWGNAGAPKAKKNLSLTQKAKSSNGSKSRRGGLHQIEPLIEPGYQKGSRGVV